MKTLNGILFLLMVTLGSCVSPAFGQLADVPTPERQAQRMSEVMAHRLELSGEQEQKVLDLNLRLAKKEKQLHNNENLDFFERLEKLKGIPQRRAKELKEILNEQQYQKFHTLNHRTRNTAGTD